MRRPEMLQSRSARILSYLILLLLAAMMIIPLWTVVSTAFSSKFASLQPGIHLWPSPFSLEGFDTLFRRLDFVRPFANTLYVTVVGTTVHVILSALGGYVLIQKDLPGRSIIAGIILLTLTIPTQVILVPLFVVFKQFHLLNTLLSLIVSEMVSAFSILLMKTYFEQVPRSMIESARIDGAGHFKLLKDFYLPLALPGVLTVAAFQIVHKYNLFIEPLLFINDPQKVTLQIALQSVILGENSTSTNDFIAPNVTMAAILLALVPLLVFYPFMQKYLIRGLTVGGVKE
ncbi:carbohydrate ABC transporter permease [Devosia sp. PTR5]|uniref:Carbohydrate ABC transporter permease n=2 Tax=Devosia oryzisoli TaxID=2774138 RepID=A0A927FXW8_9HYPH|nr:carbohydrate ABC transporter permease [Devosia oryzisoli]